MTSRPVTPQPLIREARPEDWERIAELTISAYVQGGFFPTDDDYIAELADVGARATRASVLVAEVGDHEGRPVVAGSVSVTEAGHHLAEVSRPGEMEFRMLAVHPDFQGRGIARLLVRHILSLAAARPDISAVTLCSLRDMTDAHALYRSEGFVEDPARDFRIEGINTSFPFFIRPVMG